MSIPKLKEDMSEQEIRDLEAEELEIGPLKLLTDAVKKHQKVLINCRNNRKLFAYVKAFDRHCNMILEDVKESFAHPNLNPEKMHEYCVSAIQSTTTTTIINKNVKNQQSNLWRRQMLARKLLIDVLKTKKVHQVALEADCFAVQRAESIFADMKIRWEPNKNSFQNNQWNFNEQSYVTDKVKVEEVLKDYDECTARIYALSVALPQNHERLIDLYRKSIKLLSKLVLELKSDVELTKVDKFIGYFECLLNNMDRKLMTMTLANTLSTYSADTIAILQSIMSRLDLLRDEHRIQLKKVEQELSQYSNVGNQFLALMSDYRQTQDQIQNIQLAINMML